ncbi:MAG: hypothetical protein ACTSPW_09430, partial [Promethearchaeota archaeon]
MKTKSINSLDNKDLRKKSIDELTQMFMDKIHEQNIKLIEGIEFLIDERFYDFEVNLNFIIKSKAEIEIKKAFEEKLWK